MVKQVKTDKFLGRTDEIRWIRTKTQNRQVIPPFIHADMRHNNMYTIKYVHNQEKDAMRMSPMKCSGLISFWKVMKEHFEVGRLHRSLPNSSKMFIETATLTTTVTADRDNIEHCISVFFPATFPYIDLRSTSLL